jgi:hypothetical protein
MKLKNFKKLLKTERNISKTHKPETKRTTQTEKGNSKTILKIATT